MELITTHFELQIGHAWPLAGPPSVRTTPWRSLLGFDSLANDGAALITGYVLVTWVCRELWLDSCPENVVGWWEGFKVSIWLEFGNWWTMGIWVAGDAWFWARIAPLDTKPGAW